MLIKILMTGNRVRCKYVGFFKIKLGEKQPMNLLVMAISNQVLKIESNYQ